MSAAGGAARLIVGHGARAVEDRLLREIGRLLDAAVLDPTLLARPVLVVVPSRTLRRHVAARLVSVRGRAVAGVGVRTLLGLAVGVIEKAGERAPAGEALFPVLTRRFAEAEPLLRASFTPLVDGWSSLVGTVRDLVDAGFQAEHADAVDELLIGLDDAPGLKRARAIVRVAAAVQRTQRRLGVGTAADTLRRAAHLVRTAAENVLPVRAVFVHGFAEATGVAADLIEALVARCPTTVLLDEPSDPTDAEEPDPGVAFAARLRRRVAALARVETDAPSGQRPVVELLTATTADAEARRVAVRVRTLLDQGVLPERVGVVARSLEEYRVSAERHFGRLGIPFTGAGGTGAWTPAGRRLRALVDVLRNGGAAATDAWLAASAPVGGDELELGLGLRAAGAGRIGDVASLAAETLLDNNGGMPLPLRCGIEEVAEEGGGEPMRVARRRRLSGDVLRSAVRRAGAAHGLLDGWPDEVSLRDHVTLLKRLLAEGLGWAGEETFVGRAELDAALGSLDAAVPRGFLLDRAEFVDMLSRELEGAGRAALGGRGAGIQLLGVMEARGLTFEHLFVLGLNRDLFPRPVREDPLLPDRLRRAMVALLGDLPLKTGGFDEERYLFAQLVSASPHVTLSRHLSDEAGKPAAPSSFLVRWRLADRRHADAGGEERPMESDEAPQTSFELAVAAGLRGDRGGLAVLLEQARNEECGPAATSAHAVAAARAAVLDEMDPDLGTADGRRRRRLLGPYHGFVGPLVSGGDRCEELYVTVVQNLAACPWQTFLTRVLHLEAAPDPLADLPEVGPLAVGSLVHRVLEALCGRAGELPREMPAVLASGGLPVRWPDEGVLEGMLRSEAFGVAREAGLAWPALRRILEARARPFLDVARAEDWGGGGSVTVCGTEVEGAATVADVAGRERAVRFRADRVDRHGGAIRLTDYKTGATPDLGGSRAGGKLLREIGSGRLLQGAAYALCGEPAAVGRFLYLAPGGDARAPREVVIPSSAEVAEAFGRAVRAVLEAWDRGAFFPRLSEGARDEEPRRCSYCEVRAACVRGDSGARARLARWVREEADAADAKGGLSEAERALAALWRLPEAARGGEGRV